MRKFLASINWCFRIAIMIIATRLIWSGRRLLPSDLQKRGFIEVDGLWIQPNRKPRDMIYVHFEHHYYRVYHGTPRTFIALRNTKEWFDTYYLLVHDKEQLFTLAGV